MSAVFDIGNAFLNNFVGELLSVQPGDHVLDIGCGTGMLTLRAALKGAQVTGIDINPEMIDIARKRITELKVSNRVKLVEMGVAELDTFEQSSFTIIMSGLCFSELSDDEVNFALQQIERILDKEGVEYIVVPEYGLSHFLDKANKLFLGAIAVTEDGKVVIAAGTSNIISIAHIHKLPVFLFVNSLKFSVKKSMEQNIHKKIEKRSHDDFEYTLISYSHDLVDLNLIDHLIIEKGEIDNNDIVKYRVKT